MTQGAQNIVALAPQRGVREYSASQLALIKRTVAKDCNNDEFDLYIEIAKRIGLDPFRRQIYAIVTSKNDKDKRQLVVVTGIDGYRAVAARNGDYRPSDEDPDITYDPALIDADSNPLGIIRAKVKAFKQDSKGNWNEIVGVAYWEEYAPIEVTADAYDYIDTGEVWKDTGRPKKKRVPAEGSVERPIISPGKPNWRKMPRVMLAKCAEANMLRKGWPEDLSGVYLQEEMDRADLTASEEAEGAEVQARLERINHGVAVPMQWSAGEPIIFVPIGQVFDEVSKFLAGCESAAQLNAFLNINRHGLTDFWARAKTDALELKKKIEELQKRLTEQAES